MLVGLAAMLIGGASAWAIQKCDYTTCEQWIQGRCVKYSNRCWEEAPPPPNFGAIAYGRESEAWGSSHGYDTQAQAEKVAKENCAKHGNDCQPIVWFKSQCGAVVVSANGSTVYWGLGGSAPLARKEALAKCAKDNGKDCEVKVSHCSK
jgi:hypothetical protein